MNKKPLSYYMASRKPSRVDRVMGWVVHVTLVFGALALCAGVLAGLNA